MLGGFSIRAPDYISSPSIWGIDTKSGIIRKYSFLEPKVSANLSNQFEWPLFFYSACLLTILVGIPSDDLQIIIGWLFIAGRVIHSYVQILTTNIRLPWHRLYNQFSSSILYVDKFGSQDGIVKGSVANIYKS